METLVFPIAAAEQSVVAQIAGLLAIIVFARVASELAERVRLPGVLAEIAAGIVLGASVLGWVESTETIHLLAEIGAILLLFEVGLHMDAGDLKRVGGDAVKVALIGIVAPGFAVWAMALGFNLGTNEAIFIGAAVTATSVGITARVFADMKVLASVESRTVLGAAVVDDVLALLILTFVTQTVGSSESSRSIEMTIGLAIGFLVVGGAIAFLSAPKFFDWAARNARTEGALVVATIAFALAVAASGAWAGLAPLIGAFIAGVAAARSDRHAELQRRISPVGQLIIPVFFVSVGLTVDVAVFTDMRALGLAGAITVVAILTKVASGFGMGKSKGDRILVGLGMVPRGEVGLIFATLGLSSGVLNAEDHSALVLVMLLTTLVTPPLLRMRLKKTEAADARRKAELPEPSDHEPTEETVHVDKGHVSVRGTPDPEDSLVVALQLARLAADHRVDQSVYDWLKTDPLADTAWDDESRSEFFRLLRTGSDRSFRLLETTGAFARMLPSIAHEAKHAVDPYGIEGEATWERLLELQSLLRDAADPATEAYERLSDPHLLLFAALARGAFTGEREAVKARDLASGIGLSWDQAEEIGELVGERRLLPAAALEPDLGNREQVVELISHLESQRRVTALYVLAVAEFRRDRETRARLDALHSLLLAELGYGHRPGTDDRLEHARREVLRVSGGVPDELVIEHMDQAPRRYLLTTPPETIMRHLRLADPIPGDDELRVHLEHIDHDTTRIHAVFRDRRGALASLANACNLRGLPIREATASSWGNGLAITTFVTDTPMESIEQQALESSLHRALLKSESVDSLGIVEGHISVDNHASPWHTIIDVRTPAREGVLAKVAAAIAAIGGEIVTAQIQTVDGVARDRFAVKGPDGKLTTKDERALRRTLATGKPPGLLAARR